MESPLTLFVWSARRILPVRITEYSVTEEAFDPALNPIRAKVSLGIRVLSNNITNDGKYDGGTGEACQEYTYDVIKGYIATLKR